MKTRHEQAKEEVESLVSEFESSARAFLFFKLIVILSVLQKEKIEVNQARFVRLFFVQLDLICFCQVLSIVIRSNILTQIFKLNKKWQL